MIKESTVYSHTEDVHNTIAANVVVPLVIEVLNPKSVLDVGCGIGTWLSVFSYFGVQCIRGIDGAYVDRSLLKKYITEDKFTAIDLTSPFDIGEKFDLVISLEVAEHLPESSANNFVESLVRHSSNILFSAAIPFQIGQNHINEQWQSYWVEKFERHGYRAYDWLRPIVCKDERVDVWYRQNILFFSNQNYDLPKLSIPDIVLPDLWIGANRNIAIFNERLNRIKKGKVGAWFYIKGLIKSLLYFGRSVK